MAAISLSGAKTYVYKAVRGTAVSTAGAELLPNKWYEVISVGSTGSGTGLPVPYVSAVFKTPDVSATAEVVELESGDSVYPLELKRVCKTDAEVSAEEGIIDVTDDCEMGYNASILDGYRTISGSLNGFLKFDDATGEIIEDVKEIFGLFFNLIEDDGVGGYDIKLASNEKIILFVMLNKDAKATQKQTFLIVPVLFNSLGTGAGLKDAQKRDIAWTKAQGFLSVYERVAFSGDEM